MSPTLTVIAPVYRQWHLVPALLDCLSRQSLPADAFEIILVDNGSPDFQPPPLPANARILRCNTPGSYAARNAAAALAQGDWFAFTDADCLPEPDWLAALLAARPEAPAILVGAVDMQPADATPNAYEIYDMIRGIPQQSYVSRGYGATANLATSAALFRQLGGFDGKRLSGGDAEFCRRAGALGAKIIYVGAARVGHPARSSWTELRTKARRMKGGQLTIGSTGRRLWWTFRTLIPPVIGWWRIAQASDRPLGYRLTAMGVQTRLWLVELAELVRLAAGHPPERS